MGGPTVDLDILRRAAARFEDLSDDTTSLARFAADHSSMDAGGGLAGLILSNHRQIQAAVHTGAYTAGYVLKEFSDDFFETWRAYRRGEGDNIDLARRTWSDLPQEPGTIPVPFNYPPWFQKTGDLGSDLPSRHLHEPTQLDTSIVVVDVIDAIINDTAQIDAITVGFKWLVNLLTGIDLDAVIEKVLSLVVGDWEPVGLLASLYDAYGDYYAADGLCVRDASSMVFAFWEGDAAVVARTQCQQLAFACFLNGDDLRAIGTQYAAAALGLFGALSDVAKVIDDLLGRVKEGDETFWVHADQPLPVIIGEVAGIAVEIAATATEVVRDIVILVRIAKAIIEIVLLVQAAFARFHDRLPSDL